MNKMANKTSQPQIFPDSFSLSGIAQSRFNEAVCDGLTAACVDTLDELNVSIEQVISIMAPDALEIPFALQKPAQSGRFDAVICGQTYYFEEVANGSAAGIQRVGLDFKLPIINAVLTTDTEAQGAHGGERTRSSAGSN